MELLLEIREKDIGAEAVESFALPYELRKASRAVIFNNAGEIALMAVTKHNYHKLPGAVLNLAKIYILPSNGKLLKKLEVLFFLFNKIPGCITRRSFNFRLARQNG